MKKLFTAIILFTAFVKAFPQAKSRINIKFNDNWEMFRMDSASKLKNTLNVRSGTSFKSQFNQENIQKTGGAADSVIKREVNEAIGGFENEYPLIKALKWEKISL